MSSDLRKILPHCCRIKCAITEKLKTEKINELNKKGGEGSKARDYFFLFASLTQKVSINLKLFRDTFSGRF
jgi:hypothetical protein